jgi:hypothetical protein
MGGAAEKERMEQKDQKVGKYELELSTPLAAAPSTFLDLPDLFVGLLAHLRAAPPNSVESRH